MQGAELRVQGRCFLHQVQGCGGWRCSVALWGRTHGVKGWDTRRRNLLGGDKPSAEVTEGCGVEGCGPRVQGREVEVEV